MQIVFKRVFYYNPKIGLVIVDTIGTQYRAARKDDYKAINEDLSDQMETLRKIYKNNEVVVLITNQVYSNMQLDNGVRPVGGEIVVNRSKVIIQLQLMHKNKRKAVLEKQEEEIKKEILFEIDEKGFTPL